MTFFELLMIIGGIYVAFVVLSIPMQGVPETFSKLFYLLATRWLSSGIMSGITFFPMVLFLWILSVVTVFVFSTTTILISFQPSTVLFVSVVITLTASLKSFNEPPSRASDRSKARPHSTDQRQGTNGRTYPQHKRIQR